MKSLVQEASSIAKAIDAAWIHAGKPAEFSVKILEHPKKNFLGLTTHSAKVAFFFDEGKVRTIGEQKSQPHSSELHKGGEKGVRPQQQKRAPQLQPQRNQPQPRTDQRRAEARPMGSAQASAHSHGERIQGQHERGAHEHTSHERATHERVSQWNNEMSAAARVWVNDMLGLMGQKDMPYTVQIDGFTLKVLFKEPLVGSSRDGAEERRVLANFSVLLMTALKKQFRKSLRGHKILFSHQ